MRLTDEELEVVKNKYNTDRLWSWSMVNTFMTSPYEYYLKYIAHAEEDNDNCAYATLGGICHLIIEDLYNGKIKYGDMLSTFDDGWVTAIDIVDLKFDRNDEIKNKNISGKYKENLQHFFANHKKIERNLALEKFITADINGNILQGYIDAIYKDEDGNYNIVDWKTSTKYSGKSAEEKAGQLVVYAIGLSQQGVPIDKIRICWNFLKYVSIRYQQKNGAIKTRDVERCKIGESLQTNVKMWLKEFGYEDQIDDYLKQLIDTNSIKVLPKEVQEKYIITDCYTYVSLTEKLIDRWTEIIKSSIADILLREKDYKDTHNNKVFWDTDESVKSQSYYFSTLCGYSPNLHLPYKAYLERLDAAQNGLNVFSGVGINAEISDKVIYNKPDESGNIDLSWLDDII